MYKNQLQELAQRSCFNLPSYACIREGPDHAPRFKATVNFNGETFESPTFCSTLRLAEHAAAEVALNELSRRGPSSSLAAKVLDETGIYKNLLQETAHRAGLKLPVYTTIRSGPGHTPVFTCTVELAGMTFTGNPGKTKKQAQKNAAMAAWSELKKLPRVGDPSSSSCPPDHDDDDQEQIIVARTLASLNQTNGGKTPHQKEKQQSSNRLPSRRPSYPKSNASLHRLHLQKHTYPSVPPEQAMYHMWHQVHTTQQKPHFPMVPTMGSTGFPPPPTMLHLYPAPRGQFTMPASQDGLGLLPAPVLPRYFSPYPASYVPRSQLQVNVHKVHEKRLVGAGAVELPDAAVFSQYTSPDFSGPSENVGLDIRKEECTESCPPSEEETKAHTASSSTMHSPSQKLESNQEKEIMGGVRLESKKSAEQPPSPPSKVNPVLHGTGQQHHYSSVRHSDPVHRNSPQISVPTSPSSVHEGGDPAHRSSPQISAGTSPECWSPRAQAPPRFGTRIPSPSLLYQQRPPWLAASVTIRTAVPVCSARPNVVNSSAGAAHAQPAVQIFSAPPRQEPEAHKNTRETSGAAPASSELSKLHI
ncbi:double-stranded RNA-binding protein 2-like [Oryza brachyantha]|nr:double-stranded RNA-binding protein 2-like [Oryza brachyantha]